MRIVFVVALSGLTVACKRADDIEGRWSGICTIDDPGWTDPVAMSMHVEEDNGDTLVGSGSFTIPAEGDHGMEPSTWTADIVGSHVGEQVDLSLDGQPEFEYEEVEMRLEISAIFQDDAIDGDCTLSGMGGALELRR